MCLMQCHHPVLISGCILIVNSLSISIMYIHNTQLTSNIPLFHRKYQKPTSGYEKCDWVFKINHISAVYKSHLTFLSTYPLVTLVKQIFITNVEFNIIFNYVQFVRVNKYTKETWLTVDQLVSNYYKEGNGRSKHVQCNANLTHDT